jgi:dimethylsulfide dehydrogenase subunit gamma/complex iron-sulfur molybdoenzyme family reductase subunit gamma
MTVPRALLLLLALALPAAAQEKTIPVARATEDAASPDAAAWARVPAVRVPLQPAFPGHPYISGTPVTAEIDVQALRAGRNLHLRLAWRDATADAEMRDTARFADAVAVQFPVNGRADTTPFMGDARRPVHIWHWRADGRTQQLLARGFGTAAPLPAGALRAQARRTQAGWAVVLTRPLRARTGNLEGRRTMPIAFAAWDGANGERDGFKAVTLEWWRLRF